jgi:hypothetical protein
MAWRRGEMKRRESENGGRKMTAGNKQALAAPLRLLRVNLAAASSANGNSLKAYAKRNANGSINGVKAA